MRPCKLPRSRGHPPGCCPAPPRRRILPSHRCLDLYPAPRRRPTRGCLDEADVVLVGIAAPRRRRPRIYLANRGIKTANVPIVPGVICRQSWTRHAPLVVPSVDRRRPSGSSNSAKTAYSSLSRRWPRQITTPMTAAVAQRGRLQPGACSRAARWPIIDVTRRSIEETATGDPHRSPPGRPCRAGELTEKTHGAADPRFAKPDPHDPLEEREESRSKPCPRRSTNARSRHRLIACRRAPAELAVALADAKAIAVNRAEPAAIVIGADQTLEVDGARWTKPGTIRRSPATIANVSPDAPMPFTLVLPWRGTAKSPGAISIRPE